MTTLPARRMPPLVVPARVAARYAEEGSRVVDALGERREGALGLDVEDVPGEAGAGEAFGEVVGDDLGAFEDAGDSSAELRLPAETEDFPVMPATKVDEWTSAPSSEDVQVQEVASATPLDDAGAVDDGISRASTEAPAAEEPSAEAGDPPLADLAPAPPGSPQEDFESDAELFERLLDSLVVDDAPALEELPAAPTPAPAPDPEARRVEEIAVRLERIARSLRERGPAGPLAEKGDDPLGALVTGYLLGLADRPETPDGEV